LDDLEIHDRRRACDLRENETGLIFAQAIASVSPKGNFDSKHIATTSQHLIHCRDAVAGLSPFDRRLGDRNSVASKNRDSGFPA
jgi:hypothetical protein